MNVPLGRAICSGVLFRFTEELNHPATRVKFVGILFTGNTENCVPRRFQSRIHTIEIKNAMKRGGELDKYNCYARK